jgi:pyruvate,water dikinase
MTTTRAPASDRPDFPVTWADPADAERAWRRDDMHSPFALQPLSWDYMDALQHGFDYGYARLGTAGRLRALVVNGYLYFNWDEGVAPEDEPAQAESYLAAKRAQIPLAADYWERALVELRAIYAAMDAVDVDGLSAPDLVDAWEVAWGGADRAWAIHFAAIVGPYQVLDELADLYESVIDGATPGEAVRLTAGSIDELVAVDEGIGRLIARIAASAPVADAVRGGTTDLEALGRLPGGPDVVAAIEAFLAEHGHLGQGFDDLALASWGEEPARLVVELRRRLDQTVEPARARAERLGAEADALADAFRARCADRPETLAEFERLLGHARRIGRLTETHNYWIDRACQAHLRTLAVRIGWRLVREGVLADAADVLYLRRAEVAALLLAPEDRTATVDARRAEHAHWLRVVPPAGVGRPTDVGPSGRFGGQRFEPPDEVTLRGTGASAGVIRGPARVVLGPDDFERVRAGDIVIAPSSNPSWVPLFTVAGGVVTNTGGVLSHAAVVAREFALPAVVGTGDATTRIADGRLVELDGTTGFVRLL